MLKLIMKCASKVYGQNIFELFTDAQYLNKVFLLNNRVDNDDILSLVIDNRFSTYL